MESEEPGPEPAHDLKLTPPFSEKTLDEFAGSLTGWSHPSLDADDFFGHATYTDIFLAILAENRHGEKVRGICVEALSAIVRDEHGQCQHPETGRHYDRADFDKAVTGCRQLKEHFLADEQYLSDELRQVVFPLLGLTYRPLPEGEKQRPDRESRPLSPGETIGCGGGCLTALAALFFLTRR